MARKSPGWAKARQQTEKASLSVAGKRLERWLESGFPLFNRGLIADADAAEIDIT